MEIPKDLGRRIEELDEMGIIRLVTVKFRWRLTSWPINSRHWLLKGFKNYSAEERLFRNLIAGESASCDTVFRVTVRGGG